MLLSQPQAMKLSQFFPSIRTSKTSPRGKVTSLDERREVVASAFKQPRSAPHIKARPWIEFVSDFKLTKLTDYDSYLRAGTKNLWASFHAVDTIAKALISTKLLIKKGDKVVEDENHPLAKLLVEPNPYDSWEELMYVWPFHIKFTGNAFWMKDEINGKGQPTAVYPLLPQFVEIVPDRHQRISQFIYRVNGRIIELEADEMIHFKNPHPNNVIFGLGELEAGELMLEDYINRNRLENHYVSKGGVPSGVLVREEEVEDPDEWTKFTRKWKDEYEGIDNSGKTAFLNGKWDYVKLGLTPTELQTMQRSQETVKNIFTLHGVPLSVAGMDKAANYATARQDTIHFKKWTVAPLLDMFCGKCNSSKCLTRNYDPAMRLGYELKDMADVGGIVSEYMPLVLNGAMNRNELRKLCELEEVKGKPMMDEYLISQGMVPIDMAGMGGGEVPDETIDGVNGGSPDNTDPNEKEDKDQDEKDKDKERDKEKPKPQQFGSQRKDKERGRGRKDDNGQQ